MPFFLDWRALELFPLYLTYNRKHMNKTASIIITLLLVAGIVLWGVLKNSRESTGTQSDQNVTMKDGVQYITINARGGYTPRITTADANIPTKLVVKTNGTYDCSLALVIREIGYQKVLPQTGEELIDLGSPDVGTLQGMCSMGMYNFSVKFN